MPTGFPTLKYHYEPKEWANHGTKADPTMKDAKGTDMLSSMYMVIGSDSTRVHAAETSRSVDSWLTGVAIMKFNVWKYVSNLQTPSSLILLTGKERPLQLIQ